MNAVEVAIEILIGKEGDYVDHPDDSGGATRWGITERVARKHGYQGDMKDLPRTLAVQVYKQEYFINPGFADVFTFSPSIGSELFDSGVNFGPGVPARWLQRSLNVLNQKGKLYKDLKVDGDVGKTTLGALSAYLQQRGNQGELVLLRALNCLQGAKYIELAEKREKDESFIFGWLLHRVVI